MLPEEKIIDDSALIYTVIRVQVFSVLTEWKKNLSTITDKYVNRKLTN